MYIVIICFPVCDIINFENILSFFIQPFSYRTKKVRTKTYRENYYSGQEKLHFSLCFAFYHTAAGYTEIIIGLKYGKTNVFTSIYSRMIISR